MNELGTRIVRAAAHFHGTGATPPRGWQVELCEWLSQETGKPVRQQSLSWALHQGKQTLLAPLIAKRYGVEVIWLTMGVGRMTKEGKASGQATPIGTDAGGALTLEEQRVVAALRLMDQDERAQVFRRADEILNPRNLVSQLMRGRLRVSDPPAAAGRRKA